MPRNIVVAIRATREERERWQAKARVHGVNLSALVRELLEGVPAGSPVDGADADEVVEAVVSAAGAPAATSSTEQPTAKLASAGYLPDVYTLLANITGSSPDFLRENLSEDEAAAALARRASPPETTLETRAGSAEV